MCKMVLTCVCVIAWPNGLCVDYTTNHIYWADAKLDRIEMSDISGQDRRKLVTDLHHPFGLAVVTIHTDTRVLSDRPLTTWSESTDHLVSSQ